MFQALSKLGLIDWIGKMTERVILSAPEDSRLAVAILLILWVSNDMFSLTAHVPAMAEWHSLAMPPTQPNFIVF